MLTREEIRKRRSIAGQKAINAYWAEYHANIEAPNYHELPDPFVTIQVTNHVSDKVTTMVFRPGGRRGRFKIEVDGQFWRECGWSDAMARIRKSCKRMPLYIQ